MNAIASGNATTQIRHGPGDFYRGVGLTKLGKHPEFQKITPFQKMLFGNLLPP